jgi:hypothetical protein
MLDTCKMCLTADLVCIVISHTYATGCKKKIISICLSASPREKLFCGEWIQKSLLVKYLKRDLTQSLFGETSHFSVRSMKGKPRHQQNTHQTHSTCIQQNN